MANRYSAVAKTYLGPRLLGVLWLLGSLGAFAAAKNDASISYLLLISIYAGMAFFSWSVGVHVKEQFADPRAALLPGFRAPHLIVAAIVSMIGLVSTTAVIWLVAGTSLSGPAALLLTIFTMVLWATYRPSLFSALTAFTLLALGLSSPLWYQNLIAGRSSLLAALLLASCGVLLRILVGRLMRLNEDMPEYRLLITLPASTRGAERRLWSAWQDHWQFEWQPRLFVRNIPTDLGGFWSRVRLWRVGMSPLNMATLMPLLFLPAWLVPASFVGFQHAVGSYLLWMPAMFSGTFIGSITALVWIQRWPRLGHELLRPTSRRDFCRQMGLAFALELFEGWLWTVLSVGCLVAAVRPNLLRGPDLVVFFALNGIIPLTQWAAAAWLASYSRSSVLMLIVILAVSFVPTFVWLAYLISPTPFAVETYLMMALGVVILGVAVLYLAYRRWLRLDLP